MLLASFSPPNELWLLLLRCLFVQDLGVGGGGGLWKLVVRVLRLAHKGSFCCFSLFQRGDDFGFRFHFLPGVANQAGGFLAPERRLPSCRRVGVHRSGHPRSGSVASRTKPAVLGEWVGGQKGLQS